MLRAVSVPHAEGRREPDPTGIGYFSCRLQERLWKITASMT
jgi:hypothetical protein